MRKDVADICKSCGKSVGIVLTLTPNPMTKKGCRSRSYSNSVKIPLTFFPPMTTSLGQRIAAVGIVSSCIADAIATAPTILGNPIWFANSRSRRMSDARILDPGGACHCLPWRPRPGELAFSEDKRSLRRTVYAALSREIICRFNPITTLNLVPEGLGTESVVNFTSCHFHRW